MRIPIDLHRPEMDDLHLQMRRACHDLNAPLRAVHGFADILNRREAANLSAKGAAYLARMVAATEHMEQVVAGLHSYARVASHALQRTSVAIAHLTHRLLVSHFDAEVNAAQLQWQAEESLEWPSDSTLLQQIVQALVANGLRFVVPGVVPQVAVDWQQGEQLILTVTDHGIGIAPEYHQQIFDLFVRLHGRDQYPGAGTGLALVARAVRLLGGSVELESEAGAGTTVRVCLPRLPERRP
ncbi:MAG: ATP-binding protein [Mariprofundales bacterium]|nr:ATP-binding protein [Mariprofundales bacterium]